MSRSKKTFNATQMLSVFYFFLGIPLGFHGQTFLLLLITLLTGQKHRASKFGGEKSKRKAFLEVLCNVGTSSLVGEKEDVGMIII